MEHDHIIGMVEQAFRVEKFEKKEFSLEFTILDADPKSKFEGLAKSLENMQYVARLEDADNSKRIIVQKFTPNNPQKWLASPWLPRILFGVVILFVMVDGYYRTIRINKVVEIGDPLEMAVIYTISLLGILGIHELGHLVAARMHGLRTSWPYFIPGIPIVGIPTFGAFIRSKSLTINREILFDVAIAGPVAGLAVAVIVSVYGAYTAPVLDLEEVAALFENHALIEWNQGEPLLMSASLVAFGKGADGHQVIMTPVLFAAWIGFLITFLNMLPAWQLDGGHMARTLFSPKIHRYATYASIGVLVLLNYGMMAILILVMSSRSPSASPLDDVSPLPWSRKAAYVGIVMLAILCTPIPTKLPLVLSWIPQ